MKNKNLLSDTEERQSVYGKKNKVYSAKEYAYLSVFVALGIAAQLVLSVVLGVEVVSVLFISYAYVFGARRGMLAATAFSLLRQFLFGFFPVVLVLYLLYFNGLAAFFGYLGEKNRRAMESRQLPIVMVFSCIATLCFTLLDNVITPLFFGYTWEQTKVYFTASIAVAVAHVISVGVSVFFLFLPFKRIFIILKRGL